MERQLEKPVLAGRTSRTTVALAIVASPGVVMAVLVYLRVCGALETSREYVVHTRIRNIESALALYTRDCGAPPTQSKGLEALLVRQADCPRWKGYLDDIPKDPWGRPFEYVNPGTHGQPVEIASRGKDGELETADDIRSWALNEEPATP